jgi:formiminotetrahydrofolate cyclodeaminase
MPELTDILSSAALDTFRRVLDPTDNSTGGGSASAIAGAMAASLAAMVARLSIRPDASEPESFYRAIAAAGAALSGELLAGSHEDAAAFDAVVAAYRLPKTSEGEVAVRRDAIQSAFVTATEAPLANARRCGAVLDLVIELEGRSNERAKSDLTCAWHLGEAALRGCLANVEINLPGIKDQAVRGAIAAEMEALAAAALQGDAKK